MNRRAFLAGSTGLACLATLGPRTASALAHAASTPVAEDTFPTLAIGLKDDGFELPDAIQAGRYHVTVTNHGTSDASHSALGRIPDQVTDAQYQEWLDSLSRTDGTDGQTDALTWDDIEFVGMPDWPKAGQSVSGVIDLAPGRYFLFDPFSSRGDMSLTITGDPVSAPEPESDLTVTLVDMKINLPDAAITSKPVRWKIENTGSISHEVAVIPVTPTFTEEDLTILLSLPEDGTPPAGTDNLDYQPVAAIGILAKGHTSWLDVKLTPGHYLAACMLPFGTGYPHAMDGMYRFFEVK
jgi:hypothetical protein